MTWQRISIETADKTSAATRRGAVPPFPAAWGTLLAEAQRVIGEHQERLGAHESLLNEAGAYELIAAARVLASAAETAELAAGPEVTLMAAAAHAMYGNMPAALVCTKNALSQVSAVTEPQAVAIATFAPRLLTQVAALVVQGSVESQYLEALNYFLATGDEVSGSRLHDLLRRTALNARGSVDGALLRSARIALAQLLTLSCSRALQSVAGVLPEGYVQRLIDSGHPTLLPPQYRAIVEANVLSRHENTIISLPTSTGKTLLAELALLVSLARRAGLAVYVAPYVALGGQVFNRLRERGLAGVDVVPQLGGYAGESSPEPARAPTLLVSTPEGLDALLRNRPELIDALRCVAVDEAHLIENGLRSLRLEGILTRIRLRQQAGQQIRLLLLSAVFGDLSPVAEWLGVPDELVIRDDWRPTARRLALWTEAGRLSWLQADDPVVPAGAGPGTVAWSQSVPWPRYIVTPAYRIQDAMSQQPAVNANVAYLAGYLHELLTGPVLCACGTKRTSREVAREASDRFGLLEPTPSEILDIIAAIEERHQHLRNAIPMLKRGVAFHNATVPHEVRRLIERAARNRRLRVVAATTTLAEGVDLPFRATIIERWLLGFGQNQRPMSPLIFRNIAGRCGRAGTYTEGDTVLFDNPLGSLLYAHPRARRANQLSLLMPPQTLGTAVEALEESEAAGVVGSQLLAAIAENEEVDEIAQRFVGASYSSRGAATDKLRAYVQSVVDDIQSGDPLAVAASRLRLTDLGTAIKRTGLSPTTGRRLGVAVREFDPQDSMSHVGAELLRQFALAPEQTSDPLRKAVQPRTRVPAKPDDFESVIAACANGVPLVESFGRLRAVLRSRKGVPFEAWVTGERTSPAWDQDFDKYVEFVNAAIDNFLPWLFRASAVMADAVGAPSRAIDWRAWTQTLQARSTPEGTAEEDRVTGEP